MVVRPFLVVAHRWAGLITALFLLIAGLSGAVLAFEDELESWLNPHLYGVSAPLDETGRAKPMLDPFELRERAAQALPDYVVSVVRFNRQPDRSIILFLQPKPGVQATIDTAFVDPYTGRLLGVRESGATPFARETLIGFIYRLHSSLAFPGRWGEWLFGSIAVIWTLDCFMGLALTFPRGEPFWSKWSIAWKIKRGAAPSRFNLDLHRAFSLWLWAMLLLYAWSGVMMNFRQEIYRPIMSTMFRFADLPDTPRLAQPLDHPALDWRAAANVAQAHMVSLGERKGFRVNFADNLSYIPSSGVYIFNANTSRDLLRDRGQTLVYIDGNTGKLLGARVQTGEASGDTISRWLQSLHMSQLWGLPYQIFVAFIGLTVAMLSITGVVIWWNKRAARTTARIDASASRASVNRAR